jgi:hypothetical protein
LFSKSPKNLGLDQEDFSQDVTLPQLSEVWGIKGVLSDAGLIYWRSHCQIPILGLGFEGGIVVFVCQSVTGLL